MRIVALRVLTLAGLVSITACRDAAAPEYTNAYAQTVPPSPPKPADAIFLDPERSILVGDSTMLGAYVLRDGHRGPDTLSWEVQSPGIASIEVVGKDRIRVHGLRPGQTKVTAHTTGASAPLSSAMQVRILARSAEPSPIVADEFRIIEFSSPFLGLTTGVWGYAPQLTLRDATGRGSSKVVALTVEFPSIGPPVFCAADRVVAASAWAVFAPVGSMDGVYRFPDRDVDPAAEAVARVTVRLSDTVGVLLVAKGMIVPGTWQAGWPEPLEEVAACE